MVKASDWVLKRNPKPARKEPMGPVAKFVLAKRQSKPGYKQGKVQVQVARKEPMVLAKRQSKPTQKTSLLAPHMIDK